MHENRLQASLFKATLLFSVAVFVICGVMALHNTFMAKKARQAVDVLVKMQAQFIDRCLQGDASGCVALQKITHTWGDKGLSAQDYEERVIDYGVASVAIPFFFIAVFFAGRWLIMGTVPWD